MGGQCPSAVMGRSSCSRWRQTGHSILTGAILRLTFSPAQEYQKRFSESETGGRLKWSLIAGGTTQLPAVLPGSVEEIQRSLRSPPQSFPNQDLPAGDAVIVPGENEDPPPAVTSGWYHPSFLKPLKTMALFARHRRQRPCLVQVGAPLVEGGFFSARERLEPARTSFLKES